MWKVVNEPGGTGKKAQVKGVQVAGKTGTAQNWREVDGVKTQDNHTWFISFAPYDTPKFAVTVFVQGAKSGGGVPAPIAQRIIEQSLALENGYDPGVEWLEPAVGSFAFVDQVDYKANALPSGVNAVDGNSADGHPDQETAEHTEVIPKKQRKKSPKGDARPDIRPEADARGRVAPRAQSVRPPVDRRSLFQRFFGPRRDSAPRPVPQGRGNR